MISKVNTNRVSGDIGGLLLETRDDILYCLIINYKHLVMHASQSCNVNYIIIIIIVAVAFTLLTLR